MAYADLHIHSIYSDGTLAPEEIVRAALNRGVRLISVTDHNAVEGTLETEARARAAGLDYLRGAEIDALFEGRDVHILAYGADFAQPEFLRVLRHARRQLDEMSAELVRRMAADRQRVDFAEYTAFRHDPALGGWKLLAYLRAKGLTRTLTEGFALYERYGVSYAEAGFIPAEAVIAAIHAAGGRAVLAHPGVVFPTDSLKRFEDLLERMLQTGLDGIECYYLRHAPGVTRRCLEVCTRHGLMITAGSDCHGAISHNEIGQTKTPLEALRLEPALR